MAFDYFKRLHPSQQQTYLRSDRISTIHLPDPAGFHPLVCALREALAAGNRSGVQRAAQALVSALLESLKVRPLRVRVLETRPSSGSGELQGLYQPDESGPTDRITVWMRTARRKQVVAFKTFLRTLLHELCHHLDYELLGLKETFHTEGFFKRESSLFHQLAGEEATKRDP